jgi:hydrogenase/urease accessory protein HupE
MRLEAELTMKSIAQFGQRFHFWVSFILFSIGVFTAHAHDPGLSTATIAVADRQIDLMIGLAQKDVESLLLNAGGKQVDIQSGEGFTEARSQLEFLAISEVELFLGYARSTPLQAMARRKDSQNIEILLRFERTSAWRLRLVSNLLERLPFGHREFVTVQSSSAGKLGEAMLSGQSNSFEIDLPSVGQLEKSGDDEHSFFAFLMLGVEHILTGYDHLLFLFGLLVVCRDLRSVFTVITCFTIAHSITLALSALDIVELPARVVEPLIAASIAYVGFENLLRGDCPKGRWLITFSFGLVHGLGFAGALKEFGIGSGRFGVVLPLVGFNLGVEIGQFSVAAVVLPVLWQLRKNPGFVRQWVPLCSAAVTLLGSYWMVERILQK